MADPQDERARREAAGDRPDVQNSWTRSQTDRGALGDKIPVEDPATAPLGTDAEASGAHPERVGPTGDPLQGRAEWPQGQRAGPTPRFGANVTAIGFGIVLAVVVFLFLLLLLGLF